ncbi:nucleotidyl transferase AbiEii/AbiGii toxin family protein [Nocardia sp. NBC_00508]|uniref:nucleotidyl transferase AbiEii/AbiGii toxin family protein n=1 Tax=Nocardia sp. NBC_00508 TaxID=2975992 RepID=UPI002E81CEE1|nr:nucleotidyl transferase AbiEii/AbiGii toxin family protein [Nocardia sp. NBC_00508]WUD64386.1 nucleotidyl transferase AbiEii/AbiGii toxin family protein [Nocardia sp. NBC_00508]
MIVDEDHRAALDHVLALVAGAAWGAGLVLRGSMTLQAWVGDRARPPADLDWIVPTLSADFSDPLDPFPYVDDITWVQQWPEAAAGAARYRMWTEEEFATFGSRPALPPEGLRWIRAEEGWMRNDPHSVALELVEAIRDDPDAGRGVVLDADGADSDAKWGYSYGYDTPGVRLLVPWYTDSLESGAIQLDFAAEETLPDAPVWTAIPRGDGGPPTPAITASRELSLAWKLLWLHTDSMEKNCAAGKDLYDAVVLAECPQTHLTPRLLGKVLGDHAHGFGPETIRRWRVDWDEFAVTHWACYDMDIDFDPDSWLERLAHAFSASIAGSG